MLKVSMRSFQVGMSIDKMAWRFIVPLADTFVCSFSPAEEGPNNTC